MSIFNRTRSKGSGFTWTTIVRGNSVPGGPVTYDPWPSGQVLTDGFLKSISDNVHKDYRKRVRNGEIILGDLRIETCSVESTTESFVIGPFANWGTTSLTGLLASYGARKDVNADPLRDLTYHAKNVALAKAYEKMNKSPLMTGEFLHSFKQTLGMIRQPLKASTELLVKMYKYRKKHLGKTTASATKASANAWLEYRYGWKPLIMDCETAIDETNKFRDTMKARRLVARATENVELIDNESPSPWYPSLYYTLLCSTETRAIRGTGSACAGVIYEVKPQTTIENLNRILGIRAADVLPTLWEIVPFSFVADWFVNVGSWLNAVVPDPSVNVLGNWVTRKDTWSCRQDVTWYYPPPVAGSTGTTCTVGSVTTVRNFVERECNQSLTMFPVLTKRNLSTLHLVDALSLSVGKITNLLRGLKH